MTRKEHGPCISCLRPMHAVTDRLMLMCHFHDTRQVSDKAIASLFYA